MIWIGTGHDAIAVGNRHENAEIQSLHQESHYSVRDHEAAGDRLSKPVSFKRWW
jgi:hypothetical protein